MLLDTHYHLDFLRSAQARAGVLAQLEAAGVGVVPQTLLPSDFVAQAGTVARLSLGFHPWWIASPEQADAELEVFASACERTPFIGEVGLDFSPRRLEAVPAALQTRVLRQILRLAGGRDRVLSIHAVRSATAVLDELEQVEAVTPVIHWFSGTSDELTRLIRMGGYISVNPRMLESKRGRAFVRQVPAERLLLETDLPAEPVAGPAPHAASDVVEALRGCVEKLSALRGSDVAPIIEENQRRLYGVA